MAHGHLCNYSQDTEAMKSLLFIALFLSLFLVTPFTFGKRLKEFFVNGDKVSYDGYTIARSFKAEEHALNDSRVIVSRGQKRLAIIEGCCYRESTRFALIPLLDNGRKQLVVEAYSGGGHCCTSYHIYDLSARFLTIFDGSKYNVDQVGNEMELLDIDGDGVYEFVQRVMNFDYFYASHASAVFPEVVFAYNHRAGQFRPANRRFASFLLRDIEKKERIVSKLNEDIPSLARVKNGGGSEKTLSDVHFRESYYHAVVDVLLTYIYAGRKEEGWRYFYKNYNLPDKQQLRFDLRKLLAGSTVYNSIYSKNRHSLD
jgi:hypothetical protein